MLSLTGALAHAATCDVDADGDIDRKDYLAILADIGKRASGPNDPRDADRNGRILSNDTQLCARRCTLPLCAILTNKAPIAKNNAATTALDTRVRINVIANDRDRDGRIVPRTVRIVTNPKHGKVARHRDGTVTYSPAPGFRGRDRFRYTVKDNRGAKSNVATVTVTVRPGNVPPVANNDSAATAVNTLVTINVVANDTDVNGNLDPTSVAIAANPANGAVVNNLNGTVTYTPSPGFFGTDSFTYNVKDTQGATSNVATVTVGVNAAPTANAGPDANAVTGQPVTLDGSGSSDPNGDMITFSWGFLSTAPGSNLADTGIVNPTTPAPSVTPDVDGAYELELTVTDPGGLSESDTVVITAATPNVAPNTNAGPNQNAEVLTLVNLDGSGSSDPDNGPVTPLAFQWTFAQLPAGSLLTNADITNATSAQASFTPDVIGLYRLAFTVTDGDLSDSDDVDITVALPNVPPNADAGPDMVVQLGPPAETATLKGSASDDPDDFPNPTLTFQWAFVSTPLGSTLINSEITDVTTATASFIPDVPGVYLLRLDVFDGEDTDFDEVMVTANAAPVAGDDAFDVDEDTPLTVAAPGVLANDTDANNDALTAVLVSGPSNAAPLSFTLNPDGSFDYTPAENFTGEDSFTYQANDGSADSNVATVTITVNEVNDAPVAVDDAYSVDEDNPLTGTSVLANDTDVENDAVTAVLDTGPANAQSFTLNPDGTFSYTPNADFFGTDTFTYHANDGNSDSNVATVTITVDAVNDAPSFVSGGNVTVLEDAGPQAAAWATGISTGPANESGQTVNFVITGNTNPGLFSAGPAVSSVGVLSGTSAPNAFGSATITLVLQDNGGTANGGVDTSGAQSFTITVLAVNDPPSVTPPAAYAAHAHIGISIPDGATDLFDGSTITDVDGPGAQPFSITATGPFASANGGSVTIAGNGSFSYNPPIGFTGADTFTYEICDSGVPGSACTNATATVNVSGPRVWFVNNSLGSPGDGRLSSPFNTLAAVDTAADANGDRVFVLTGGGTYTGGFALFTNQHLIGQGVVDTNFDTALGITPPATSVARPAINGTRPTINGTINLATGGTARGFNVNHTAATGVSGNGATGLTVNQVSVTTTTGVAVNLANSGGAVSFTSVSANGAANGIVLNNTTGSFAVTGTGTAGTGGTIQNMTGPGILLSNAANVSLARINIQNGDDDGIRGTTVSGFTLTNSTVQNNGDAIGAFDAGDNGLDFTDLLGTASISDSVITGSFHNNIIIRNSTGVLSGLTVSGATISNNVSASDGDGFLFEASGTANMSVNISGSTFSAHQGDHFQAAALNSGVLNVIFSGNTLSGGHANPLGQGITINAATGVPGYLGSVSYDIDGNTINGAISNAIFVGLGTSAATSSMTGKIRNNTIGTLGSALSCSTQANGVYVDARGNGTFTSQVSNNVIRQCFDRGILSEAGDGDSVLNLTVTGNTIDQQVGALSREAFQTNHGITSTNVFGNVDTNAVCLQLGGAGALANTFSHGPGAPDDFRLRKRHEATVRLPGYAGGTGQDLASLAQVVAFIQGQNTGSAGEPGSASASGAGGGYTGGAACPLPP